METIGKEWLRAIKEGDIVLSNEGKDHYVTCVENRVTKVRGNIITVECLVELTNDTKELYEELAGDLFDVNEILPHVKYYSATTGGLINFSLGFDGHTPTIAHPYNGCFSELIMNVSTHNKKVE